MKTWGRWSASRNCDHPFPIDGPVMRWNKLKYATLYIGKQTNVLCYMNLYLLSVWDRWESWWQNAGPTTQPAASQLYGSKRHSPKCQNHRTSSCEPVLPAVHRKGTDDHPGSGPGHESLHFWENGGEATWEITRLLTLNPNAQNSATQVSLKTITSVCLALFGPSKKMRRHHFRLVWGL